jgi:HPt (histidine-containing phosphotransfer) domain-containing protein
VDLDPQQLKQKALLLLQRERELFELRGQHEGLAVWLALAQSLPPILADPHINLDEIYAKLRKSMTISLRFQRVLFFEVGETLLRPLSPAGAPRPFKAEAVSVVESRGFGLVNDANDGSHAALAEALGLERFIWSRIDVRGKPPVLLVAGYDKAKAKFYPAFDESTAANLRNTTQHLEGLLGNAVLLSQIQDERDRLKQTNELLKSRDAELSTMASELQAANERLEQRVAKRTGQLLLRNSDMRLVLDNVPTALLTVDAHGRLAAERSAKVDEWFGSYQGTPCFADYVASFDPVFAQWFELGYETLLARTMPPEICLEQLPRRLRYRDRIYQCSYRLIGHAEEVLGLLVTIEDITKQRRLEQEEVEQREILAFCAGLTRDRAGFLTFFEEADRLVREIVASTTNLTLLKRNLHTLKGSAAMMGGTVLPELCGRAEEELVEHGPKADEVLTQLRQRWFTIVQTIEPVLGEGGRNIVEIPGVEFNQLCRDVERGLSQEALRLRLQRLTFEPIERPLGRLARYAQSLGDRLGKTEISVNIRTDGTLVDPRRLRRLWTALVHVVRNAIDHGIEPPADRLARGKPASGQMNFRALQTARELTIEVEDDGRGIDWGRVTELARARGMAHETEDDLVRGLLSDGFTTKSTADGTSGRGVGLCAVAQTVTSLGGSLSLRSQPGRGTTWSVVLPLMPAEGQLASQDLQQGEWRADG